MGRARSFGGKLKGEYKDGKACSVSHKISKKKPRAIPDRVNKHSLPQDFIDKQRAYFAEIDAFELPEEVVSENELE